MTPQSAEVAQTLGVEAKGNRLFDELVINRLPNFRFIQINDNTETGLFLQRRGIDYMVVTPEGYPGLYGLEIKTEQFNKYGTLFIEHLQNIFPPRPGWLHTCSSELLVYQFLSRRVCYVMSMSELKAFLTESPIYAVYGCRIQKKYNVSSQSAGFCVPIEHLRLALRHFFEIKAGTPAEEVQRVFLAINE